MPHISNCVVPGQRASASVPSDRKGCQEEPEREQKVAKIFSKGKVLFRSLIFYCPLPPFTSLAILSDRPDLQSAAAQFAESGIAALGSIITSGYDFAKEDIVKLTFSDQSTNLYEFLSILATIKRMSTVKRGRRQKISQFLIICFILAQIRPFIAAMIHQRYFEETVRIFQVSFHISHFLK